MPPPMPNPSKRMTANPARPVARYRPGKVTQQEDSSDEDDEEVEQPKQQYNKPRSTVPPSKPRPAVQQHDDDDDEEGFVTEEEEEGEDNVPAQSRSQQPRSTQASALGPQADIRQPHPTVSEAEAEQDSESSEDEDSSEEESSEEEAPRRKFQRPTFIKKSDRNATTDQQETSNGRNSTPAAHASTVDEDEQLRRRAQAELLIQDKLERDARARAAGKKSWDDDDDLLPEHLVDDTDGLDPDAEYQAWKLRELKRLKRDREALEAREREIEELERRRNLTAEERDREDEEFITKQKAEREDRSKANYMARYHHKGAFFQDDENAELLKKRDIIGARFADEVQDKSVLPEYMRIRDMTKLGKKGRTRYTDLKGQDTGRFGEDVKRWRGVGDTRAKQGIDNVVDVDERFLPDADRRGYHGDRNEGQVDHRRRSRSRSPKRRRSTERDEYHRRRSYSHSRSRSRSPQRKKRSPSPYQDRDKRRKVDV